MRRPRAQAAKKPRRNRSAAGAGMRLSAASVPATRPGGRLPPGHCALPLSLMFVSMVLNRHLCHLIDTNSK